MDRKKDETQRGRNKPEEWTLWWRCQPSFDVDGKWPRYTPPTTLLHTMDTSNPLKHMKSISPGKNPALRSLLCVLAFLPCCQFAAQLCSTEATSQVFSVYLIISRLSISYCRAFPGDNTSGACHSTQVHPQCKTLITKQSPHFSLEARKDH